MFVVRLLGVLMLIALNGFFAAAEFSLVAVRLSRVRQLVAKGNLRARVVEQLVGDLRRVVSGVQLGITLSSLAIGALGEASLAAFFQRVSPAMPGRTLRSDCACAGADGGLRATQLAACGHRRTCSQDS